jgi:hypothetical protein
MRVLIKVTELRPPDLARDKFREICKKAFAHIAHYWYKNFFPRHFTSQAKRKYNHTARNPAYVEKKKRLARRGIVALGGAVDGVFTGRMANELLAGAIVRAFPTRGRITMKGPNYMRINFRKAGRANLKRELTTVSDDEFKILLAEFKRFVAKEFKAWRGSRRQKTYS